MKIKLPEFIFLLVLSFVAYWLYIVPLIFNNHLYYILLGGADDSSYGILAQRILENGLQGVYNLNFAPLFSIFIILGIIYLDFLWKKLD